MLIGKKGTTKKRIESETRARLNIPKQGVENEDIQISGDSKFAVAMACNRIDSIVSSARQRQGFTHFISVPCNSQELQNSFKGMYLFQEVGNLELGFPNHEFITV